MCHHNLLDYLNAIDHRERIFEVTNSILGFHMHSKIHLRHFLKFLGKNPWKLEFLIYCSC